MSKIPVKIVSAGGIGRNMFKGSELVLADANSSQPFPMTQADYSALSFSPSSLPNLAAWYRKGVGMTDAGGGACSQWADQSGNARHLTQASGTSRPAIQADGSLLFDGSDDFMSAAFALAQPYTFYLLCSAVTWTTGDGLIANGGGVNRISQVGVSPNLRATATGTLDTNPDLALNVRGVVSAVYNGASSSIRTDTNAAVTGDLGVGDLTGINLGSRTGITGSANFYAFELVAYGAAHDASTQDQVIAYLNTL